MYLVKKGFANKEMSASKGKVIDIKNKSLATALENAGFITPYSEKEMTNKEMEKTIKELTKEINEKDSEIQNLLDRISELEETLNNTNDKEVDNDLDNEKQDDLDNNEE